MLTYAVLGVNGQRALTHELALSLAGPRQAPKANVRIERVLRSMSSVDYERHLLVATFQDASLTVEAGGARHKVALEARWLVVQSKLASALEGIDEVGSHNGSAISFVGSI